MLGLLRLALAASTPDLDAVTAQLQQAVQAEDFQLAAKLKTERDALQAKLAREPAAAASAGGGAECPKGCKCSQSDDCAHAVICGRKMKKFPAAYPDGTDCVFLQSPGLGKQSVEAKQKGLQAVPASTKRLDMAESGIGQLGSGWLSHLSELRVLNLEFTKLQELEAGAFQGLSKLKVLWVTGNHYTLEDGAAAFKRMDASKNMITTVDKDAFAGLHNLQVLLMHHNNITELDDTTFRDLGKLKVLKIVDNPVAKTLKKSSPVFDPIRKYCYQLDIKRDSGDELEDLWEKTKTYLNDDWFEGPVKKKKGKGKAKKEL
mmetsp:Transcript_34763/g.77807  ORF Transcript_34763/g.77807 Transcript_34763/m.77807 type:complete len:317 (+) Transcript_34763:48-998(+)|eukprot:CAMPEP_0204324532 /NCGR_PEP_ID=MMETSP0469-20131031/10307_1 /ASSEMBLY_ACC=CAM_ASM_000384 /TAXON_ID=2969 /ORGANISM="Oxyrrhis marina" /LENGTH=316 /DNA_ID=CAMNT_0051306209 /DNA_START=18 /DNA_END=968 /DNA_ORIENTATION=-